MPSKIFLTGSPLFSGIIIKAIPNNMAKKIICNMFLLLLAAKKKLSGTTSTIIWRGLEFSTFSALFIFMVASEAYFSLSSIVISSGNAFPG